MTKMQKDVGFLDRPTESGFFVATWGERARTRVSAQQSRNKISVVELRCPMGFGPPRHLHREDDEIFFVQQGEIAVWLPDSTMLARPGDVVFFPRRIPHAWCAVGSQEPTIEIITVPGQFEAWLQIVAERHLSRTDTTALEQAAVEAGMDVAGPPLSTEEVMQIVQKLR